MTRPVAIAALLGLSLAACGPGAGGDSQPLGGIDGGGFSKGTITGFGSIIVNGITFSTSDTTFTIDGRPGTQSDLHVGDVVSVIGSIDGTRGTAQRVIFDDDVQGPVESIAAGRLTVMGQAVRIGAHTSFDDSAPDCSAATLRIGRVVEVSGFRGADGEVRASRIECIAGGGELEVTGLVNALEASRKRLRIGALIVDYSQAQLLDFDSGEPADGQTVEARGTSLTGGVLTATRLELEDTQIPATDGSHVDLEGLVTRFGSAADFDVTGQRVSTGAATRIRKCTLPLSLAINSFVKVKGTFEAGAIVAEEIECRTGTALRISGNVDSVDADGGTLRVLGTMVLVDSGTRLEDKSELKIREFRLADLRTGDFVDVRGAAGAAPDSIVASRLERDDPQDDIEIHGRARSLAQPMFVLLGTTIQTRPQTGFEDEDGDIAVAEFFARAPGRLVNVRGTAGADATVIADEVELDDGGDDDDD